MENEKLISNLKGIRQGLTDVHNLVGRVDAGFVRSLLELYITGVDMLITKLDKENTNEETR